MQIIRLFLIFGLLMTFIVSSQAQIRVSELEPFTRENIDHFGIISRLKTPSDELEYPDVGVINRDATILAAGNGSGQLWYWNLLTGEATILNEVRNCDCVFDTYFESDTNLLHFGSRVWDLNTNMLLEDWQSDIEENELQLKFNGIGAFSNIDLLYDPLSLIDTTTDETICEFFPAYEGTTVFDSDLSQDGQYLALSVHAYNHVNFRPPSYRAAVYNRQCEIVAFGGDGDGLTFTEFVAISPDNRYFAYSVYGDKMYLTTIPNSIGTTEIDTTLSAGSFVFTTDSELLIVGNAEGIWAYDIEAQTPHLLYDFGKPYYGYYWFYNDNVLIVPASDEEILLFGIVGE